MIVVCVVVPLSFAGIVLSLVCGVAFVKRSKYFRQYRLDQESRLFNTASTDDRHQQSAIFRNDMDPECALEVTSLQGYGKKGVTSHCMRGQINDKTSLKGQ